ncbi:MAG TPA: glycosyltransferase family 2 protein [Vicinamibacterales bacterium]|nr:glycosyltransferase family 2 protein [Vicinamibacterales bacterium]
MDPKKTISIIVTAMNEEGNLAPTVNAVISAAAPHFDSYEVIIVDDGSRDGTSQLADDLAAANPRIVVHHNPVNRGLAASYRIGIALAKHEYTAWVAGNNLIPSEAFDAMFAAVGRKEIVSTFLELDVRGWTRRKLSQTFTRGMNLLFGTRLRYFTGPCVYRSRALRGLRTVSEGSMFVAEVLLRLVLAGETYTTVGIYPLQRTSGSTKSFRLKNVANVLRFVALLFFELRILHRPRVAHPNTSNDRKTAVL